MENEREIKREMTQPQVPSKTGQTQDNKGGCEEGEVLVEGKIGNNNLPKRVEAGGRLKV